MNLLIANPPRRRRSKARRAVRRARRAVRKLSRAARAAALRNLAKGRRRRRRSSTPSTPSGGSIMARRRSSSRRRSSRRRGGGGGGFPSARGFVPPGTLTAVAATAGGFIGAQFVINKLAEKLPEGLRSGYGLAAVKAGIGVAAYFALKRFSRPVASGLAIGAMTSGALDAYNTARGGMSGLGNYMLPPMTGSGPAALDYSALNGFNDAQPVAAIYG